MAEDSLAQLLAKASADPAHKPEFVKALLTSTIFVMGEIEGEDPAARSQAVLNPGSKVILRSQLGPDGKAIVPFFTSFDKLRGFVIGEKVKYLEMAASMLFDIARGSGLVLNPGSPVTMRISAEDLAKLAGQITSAPPKSGPLN